MLYGKQWFHKMTISTYSPQAVQIREYRKLAVFQKLIIKSFIRLKFTNFYLLYFCLLKFMAWINRIWQLSPSVLPFVSFVFLWHQFLKRWREKEMTGWLRTYDYIKNVNNHYSLGLWWKTTLWCTVWVLCLNRTK